ncbi:MAG: asparaginase [Eubacteriales bacterium]|nr:asparaginase [Eubacteriales bacterium]
MEGEQREKHLGQLRQDLRDDAGLYTRPDIRRIHRNTVAAESRKKLLLLATGGTIASAEGAEGLEPEYSIEDVLHLLNAPLDFYDIEARDILSLDSSNIQPEEWRIIAEAIVQDIDHYDGIVITHGTDTMAYTASVLSFMLQGLPIPIVLTGAQRPITEVLSDASTNLLTAFAMAASGLPGVFLAFGGEVILGSRAVKTHTSRFQAFESVNLPAVARIDTRGLHFNSQILPYLRSLHADRPFEARLDLCTDVFLLKLTPGMRPELFDHLLAMEYKGLVIEAFGIGGIHFLHRDLIQGLEKLLQQGIPVVVTSQCLYEHTDFSLYATGRKLLEKGAIEAFDMTSEAAVTKLIWALGQKEDIDYCRMIFDRDLAGEVHIQA